MVPFFTPMKQNGSFPGAYIAPVNHNKINTGIAVNIASTMMGRFAQDESKDTPQLQVGGPVGLPPSPFFIFAGNSKFQRAKKERKKRRNTD